MVVCRQLGFNTGDTGVGQASFGKGTGPIWLDDIDCSGEEKYIRDCGNNGWGVADCDHTEDAGVRCYGEQLNDFIA